jgi:hypothetical protein
VWRSSRFRFRSQRLNNGVLDTADTGNPRLPVAREYVAHRACLGDGSVRKCALLRRNGWMNSTYQVQNRLRRKKEGYVDLMVTKTSRTEPSTRHRNPRNPYLSLPRLLRSIVLSLRGHFERCGHGAIELQPKCSCALFPATQPPRQLLIIVGGPNWRTGALARQTSTLPASPAAAARHSQPCQGDRRCRAKDDY